MCVVSPTFKEVCSLASSMTTVALGILLPKGSSSLNVSCLSAADLYTAWSCIFGKKGKISFDFYKMLISNIDTSVAVECLLLWYIGTVNSKINCIQCIFI